MSLRFAVVHEAEADFRTATELADRVLIEAIDWLDEDLLPDQRDWVGHEPNGQRLTWAAIGRLAQAAGIRARGHFDGEPGLADAGAARRAILYLRATFPDVKAVLLIRDRDDQAERRVGLEQARGQDHGGVVIVVGLAVVERECWVISGFEPVDDGEPDRLGAERVRLGFDPRACSHELTAGKDDTAIRSPKRVLRQLCGDDRQRERRCWTATHLDLLRERGGENGLADYLREVRDRLGRLFGHVPDAR